MPTRFEFWLAGHADMAAPWRKAIHKTLHDALGSDPGNEVHQAGQVRGKDTPEPIAWYAQAQQGGIRLLLYQLEDANRVAVTEKLEALQRINLPNAAHNVTLRHISHSSWTDYLAAECAQPAREAWTLEFRSPTVFRHLGAAWDSPVPEYLVTGVCRRARLLEIADLEPAVLQKQIAEVRGLRVQRQSLLIKGDTPTPCFTGRMTLKLTHASLEWQQWVAIARVVNVGWRVAYGFGALRIVD